MQTISSSSSSSSSLPAASVMNDNAGKTFDLDVFNPSEYMYEEIYVKLSQIRDLSNPLRDVHAGFVEELEQDMTKDGKFDYASGMMSAVFREGDVSSSPGGPPLFSKHKVGGYKSLRLLNNAYMCTIADGRHRLSALRNIDGKSREDVKRWTQDLFRVQLIRRRDGKAMSLREVLIFSSQKNTKSTRVRRDTSILSFLGRVMAYSQAFEESYKFPFLEASTECIAKDMESTDFLNGLQRESCKRYIRLTKTVVRYPKVHEFLQERFRAISESGTAKTYITYITDGKLLACNEADMLILLESTVRFIENPECTLFHANLFFSAALKHLHSLQDYHRKLVRLGSNVLKPVPASFLEFFESEFSAERQSVLKVSSVFHNHVLSINFKTHRDSEKVENVMATRRRRLLKQLDTVYIRQDVPDSGKTRKQLSAISTGNIISKKRRTRSTSTSTSQQQPQHKKAKETQQKSQQPQQVEDDSPIQKKNPDKGKVAKKTPSTKSGGLKKPVQSDTSTSSTTSSDRKTDAPVEDVPDVDMVSSPKRTFEATRKYDCVPDGWSNTVQALKNRKPLDGVCTSNWLINCRRHPSFRNKKMERDMDASLQYDQDGETVTDVSPYLRACFIPEGHHAHVYLTSKHVKTLRDLVWKWAHVKEMHRLTGTNKWNGAGTVSYTHLTLPTKA